MRRIVLAVVAAVALSFSSATAEAGLFHHHNRGCCDAAPAYSDCGCDAAPACGCDVAPVYAAPSCGCEVAPACGCDVAPSCGCGHRHGRLGGLFGRHHHRGADCGCNAAPAYGYAAPSCGCGY